MRDYTKEAKLYEKMYDATSKYQASTLIQLQTFDKLCTKCLKCPDTELLCTGTRLVVDVEGSEKYSKPMVKQDVCTKYAKAQAVNDLKCRIRASHIPETILRSTYNSNSTQVTITVEGNFVVDGEQFTGTTFYLEDAGDSSDVTNVLLQYGIAGIKNGFRVKFLYAPVFFSNYPHWDARIFSEYGDEVDVLVLARFDLANPAAFQSDLFLNLLLYRKQQGLVTIASMQSNKKIHERNKAITKELLSWNKKLPLLPV